MGFFQPVVLSPRHAPLVATWLGASSSYLYQWRSCKQKVCVTLNTVALLQSKIPSRAWVPIKNKPFPPENKGIVGGLSPRCWVKNNPWVESESSHQCDWSPTSQLVLWLNTPFLKNRPIELVGFIQVHLHHSAIHSIGWIHLWWSTGLQPMLEDALF